MRIPLSRTWYLTALVALMCAAFALRVVELDTMPRGQHYDEALKVIQSWQLLDGQWTVLVTGGPPEPFNIPIRAAWFLLLPPTTFGARLLTVFVGMIAVAAVVPLVQVVFRRYENKRWIALLALILMVTFASLVLIQRQMYRANYVPLFAALGVALLWYGLDTRHRGRLFLAGFVCAWACVFYLGGLFFLPAVALIVLLTLRRWQWRGLACFALGFGLPWIPWGIIMALMPDTIQIRTNTMQIVSFADGSIFTTYLQTLLTLFLPGQQHVATMIYSVSTLPLLPIWSAPLLVVAGLRALFDVRVLSLLLTTLFFLGAVSTTFEVWHPLRGLGHLPFTAALIAFGLVTLAERVRLPRRTLALGVLVAGIGVGSVYSTWDAIRYKFTADPAFHNSPNHWLSFNSLFHYGLTDVTGWMKQQPERAFYVPLDTVNHASMAALLLPFGYERRIWQGEPLPDGTLVMPVPGYFDFPPIDTPLQYVLIKGHALTVLPPVSRRDGEALLEHALTTGEPITGIASTHETVRLLPVGADDFAFAPPAADNAVLARFGDGLALVRVDAPEEIAPGQRFPVTTWWRASQPPATDLFARVQPMDTASSAQAYPADTWMLRYVYPAQRWQPGQLVPITQWMTLYDTAPPGGYSFLVGVYTMPGHRYLPVTEGRRLTDTQALVGVSRVPFEVSTPLPDDAALHGVEFGGALRLEASHITVDDTTITVRLDWHVTTPPGIDYTLFVHGMQGGTLVAQRDFQPFEGRLPTRLWRSGERITQTVTFRTDEFTPDEPVTFTVGMYDPLTFQRAALLAQGVAVPGDVWPVGEMAAGQR